MRVEGDEHVVVREFDLIARPRTLRVKASSLTLVPGLADRIRHTPSILDWKSCPNLRRKSGNRREEWRISPMRPKHIIFLEANHGGHTVAKPITTEERSAGSFRVAFSPRRHGPEPSLDCDVWPGKHKPGKCRSATWLGRSATCSPSPARITLSHRTWDSHVGQAKRSIPFFEKVDTEKRILLKRLILGPLFAVPAIASFPMDGLKVYALTIDGNMTHS